MAKIMFLDESGDHSLAKIDPQYPVFVLCGIIIDGAYHETTATAALNEFKDRLFGKRNIILHTADFTRNHTGFELMVKHEFRTRFFAELQSLVRSLNFQIVACAVRKAEHAEKYGLNAIDPYMLALSVLVERFIFECGMTGGSIVAEGRDTTLNNALDLAFLDLKIRGTSYVSATRVQKAIRTFAIRDKRENIAGLQLADVVATPIGRHVLGAKTYPKYSESGDFYSVVEKKFRRGHYGQIEGMGLIVLPK